MQDNILEFLKKAKAELLEQKDLGLGSRELALVLTHVDTAILWRQEDLRLKTPVTDNSNVRKTN